MSLPLQVVAVSGGLSLPSKSHTLVQAIIDHLHTRRTIDVRHVRLSDIGPRIGATLVRREASADLQEHLRAIESADLLVVGTPTYRATYSGLFKHLFDLVDQNALIDRPVLLSATGGSTRHALIIEHQLRPLFSFFQAMTLPIGVYGTDADFRDGRIESAPLHARIELAVERALPWLRETRLPQAAVA